MEIPHIGQHCAAQGCNQLDFLPFKCPYSCKLAYCLEHKDAQHHTNCSGPVNNTAIQCPICESPVNGTSTRLSEAEINRLVEQHISEGCPPYNWEAEKKRLIDGGASSKRCMLGSKCSSNKEGNSVIVSCKACGGRYCLKHRLEADHACVSLASPQRSGPGRSGPSSPASSPKPSSQRLPPHAQAAMQRAAQNKQSRNGGNGNSNSNSSSSSNAAAGGGKSGGWAGFFGLK
ncbi:hypothetical protein HDV05_006716 [Chytridiales sp. JEL 0842]|nr:hypothetical protein HDV05_006716 [Chytridiales sp. JEL 0842]